MDVWTIIEKYYEKGSQLYNVLVTHSELVTKKALAIVDAHPELNADRKFVEEAAMLHDIGIFMVDAPRIGCMGKYPYIAHGYLGADLMREEGYERHSLVCERHTGCGLSLEMIEKQGLPIPHRDMRPVSIEEKVICYADKFYSKTHLEEELSVEVVREKMGNLGVETLRQFDEWRLLFEEV